MTKNDTILLNNAQYAQWVDSLSQRIRHSVVRSAIGVNRELIMLYWSIGKDIVEMQEGGKYGDALIYRLSEDLQREFPTSKGYSYRNLHYMKNMYLTFSHLHTTLPQFVAESPNTNLPQAVAESALDYVSLVPWGHIRYLLDKRYSPEKAFFYITQIVEYGWSRNMLLNMISTDLYETKGASVNNFVQTLPPMESDYAQEIIKDPYHFDFLGLTDGYKERDLQLGLEENISRFLLELGEGFAYVGRQVKLDINGDEYYCDLLFYHLKMRRYVVVELKTGKFEPEFVSKLNLYCTAIDHMYKSDIDGDTIGLLICKEKNDLVAQWTVEKSQQPIAITRYELNRILSLKRD